MLIMTGFILIDTFTFFDNFTAGDALDYLTGEITSFFGFCLSGGQGSQRVASETAPDTISRNKTSQSNTNYLQITE